MGRASRRGRGWPGGGAARWGGCPGGCAGGGCGAALALAYEQQHADRGHADAQQDPERAARDLRVDQHAQRRAHHGRGDEHGRDAPRLAAPELARACEGAGAQRGAAHVGGDRSAADRRGRKPGEQEQPDRHQHAPGAERGGPHAPGKAEQRQEDQRAGGEVVCAVGEPGRGERHHAPAASGRTGTPRIGPWCQTLPSRRVVRANGCLTTKIAQDSGSRGHRDV